MDEDLSAVEAVCLRAETYLRTSVVTRTRSHLEEQVGPGAWAAAGGGGGGGSLLRGAYLSLGVERFSESTHLREPSDIPEHNGRTSSKEVVKRREVAAQHVTRVDNHPNLDQRERAARTIATTEPDIIDIAGSDVDDVSHRRVDVPIEHSRELPWQPSTAHSAADKYNRSPARAVGERHRRASEPVSLGRELPHATVGHRSSASDLPGHSHGTACGGESGGAGGGGRRGRYESEAAREALLKRLLAEYRQNRGASAATAPRTDDTQGLRAPYRGGDDSMPEEIRQAWRETHVDADARLERDRAVSVIGSDTLQEDDLQPPSSPADTSSRMERLLLDSPERESRSPYEDQHVFYASDLIGGSEEKKEQEGEQRAPQRLEDWLPIEGLTSDVTPPSQGQAGSYEQEQKDAPAHEEPEDAMQREIQVHAQESKALPLSSMQRRDESSSKRSRVGGGPRDEKAVDEDTPLPAEFTFKPQVLDYEKVTNKPRPPLKETINTLARPQLEVYAERERERMEREMKKYEGCTFRPKLCKGTERRVKAKASSSLPVPERLVQRSEEVAMSRITSKHQLEEQKMQECTFKPQINPDSVAIVEKTYKPIHQRVADIQRAKRENLNALRESAEYGNPDLTFQPRISGLSDKLARTRLQDAGVSEGTNAGVRLCEQSKRFAEQRLQKLIEVEKQRMTEHTYAPKLSKGTEKIARAKDELKLGFLDRQNVLGEKVQKKMAEKHASCEEQHKKLFKPSIGKAEEILRKRKPEYANENIERRVERLSYEEKIRMEQDRARREQEYYAKYTFEPEINRVSRLLGRPSTTQELVHNWRGELVRVRAMEEAEARMSQECTFNPKLATRRSASACRQRQQQLQDDITCDIDVGFASAMEDEHSRALVPRSRGVCGNSAKPRLRLNLRDPEGMQAEMERYRREKDEYSRHVRTEKEIQELEKCTFQPAINRHMVRAQTPVIVRGLGRFLENKEHALRLKREKEERDKEVFEVRPASRAADGTTLVRPFRLSQGRNSRNREAVKQEVERDLHEKCTFTPRTVESRRREAIRKLLDEDSRND